MQTGVQVRCFEGEKTVPLYFHKHPCYTSTHNYTYYFKILPDGVTGILH